MDKELATTKMKLCLEEIRSGKLSIRAGALKYGFSRGTVWGKLSGKSPVEVCRRGPEPSIGSEQEQKIVDWVKKCSDKGMPVTKHGLEYAVKQILEKMPEDELVKRRLRRIPGKNLIHRIIRRHKNEIKLQKAQLSDQVRGSISEFKIRAWFDRIKETLKEENALDVLNDPNRMFNCDETTIHVNTKGAKILGKRGKPVSASSNNDEKSNVTVLFTVSAEGSMLSPFFLFKYIRFPSRIAEEAPDGVVLSCNESGSMTAEKFHDYISDVFVPYLDEMNVQRPVILFLDGHISHLSLPLSDTCAKSGIILIVLPAYSAHILQPLNVSFFRPLKAYWGQAMKQFKLIYGRDMEKQEMTGEVKTILIKYEQKLQKCIVNGFRVTGLYPFDMNNVNFTKLCPKNITQLLRDKAECMSPKSNTFLELYESFLDPDLLKEFQECMKRKKSYRGDTDSEATFKFWSNLLRNDRAYEVYIKYNSNQQDMELGTSSNSIPSFEPDMNSENFNNDIDEPEAIEPEPVEETVSTSNHPSTMTAMFSVNSNNADGLEGIDVIEVEYDHPFTTYSCTSVVDQENQSDENSNGEDMNVNFENTDIIDVDEVANRTETNSGKDFDTKINTILDCLNNTANNAKRSTTKGAAANIKFPIINRSQWLQALRTKEKEKKLIEKKGRLYIVKKKK